MNSEKREEWVVVIDNKVHSAIRETTCQESKVGNGAMTLDQANSFLGWSGLPAPINQHYVEAFEDGTAFCLECAEWVA